ncbi:MAG: CC_3452 family protein [Sphingomicrobium sp.]
MLRPALFLSALAVIAAPAAASSYSAKLAVPTSERIIARDITWSCGADACQGSTMESRPVVLCQSLAKRAGKVDSFLADGRAFTAAELDQCNASAKAQPTKALAAQ